MKTQPGDVLTSGVCVDCGHPFCPCCGSCMVHDGSFVILRCDECGYRGMVTNVERREPVGPVADSWGILH